MAASELMAGDAATELIAEAVMVVGKDMGVDVPFFCTALRSLGKSHGNRMGGPYSDHLRAALGLAEFFYKLHEPAPTKAKRKSRKASA